MIYNDNRRILSSIEKEGAKESKFTREAGSFLERIQQEVDKAATNTIIRFSKGKLHLAKRFT